MLNRILVLLLCSTLQAANITVCASGCNQTSVPVAYTNASPGDIIIAKAGEIHDVGGWVPEWKSWGKKAIRIRSSRWAEFPAPGTRVSWATHGHLMPIFRASTGNSTPLLKIAYASDYITMSSADPTANTLTGDTTVGIVNGDPIACRPRMDAFAGTMPGGILENVDYYIRDASGVTFSLAHYKDGPVIDITSNLAGTIHCVPSKTARNLIFEGIAFRHRVGVESTSVMFSVGSTNEASRLGMPSGITARMIAISGDEGINGPKTGFTNNGRGTRLIDSSIDEIKYQFLDSVAVYAGSTSEGLLVKNVLASAATHSFLSGGGGVAIRNGVVKGARAIRLFAMKRGSYIYNARAGAPTGACFTGRYYRDTSVSPNTCAMGACYRCVAGVWEQDLDTYYQDGHYLPKAIIEFKQCLGCSIQATVIKNGPAADDTGNPGACLMNSQVDPHTWSRVENSLYRDIYCDNAWRGITIGTDGGIYVEKNKSINFKNILITNLADYPAMSIHTSKGDVQSLAYRLDASTENSLMEHITIREAPGSPTGNFWLQLDAPFYPQMLGTYFRNNTGPQYGGLFASGSNGTCDSGGLGKWVSSATQIANNLQNGSSTPPLYSGCTTNMANANPIPYVSASNSRLSPGSPYSADCVSGCAFKATDDTDVGVDNDRLESEIANVEAGLPGWIPNLKFTLGSTRAVVSYWAPDTQVCTVTLYTDKARLIEHADTTGANKNDNRAGSITVGRSRQVALGTVSALTANTSLYYKVACPGGGGQYRVGEFKTFPAASAGQLWGFSSGGQSVASRISASADMSSPTAISANVNPRVVVPQGAIRYWQVTNAAQNGPIQIVVAR